jgi:hypothetical protein
MASEEVKEKSGHENLIENLELILKKAKEFEYHDFLNTRYPFPKMRFVADLETVIKAAKSGHYDNDPDDPEVIEKGKADAQS